MTNSRNQLTNAYSLRPNGRDLRHESCVDFVHVLRVERSALLTERVCIYQGVFMKYYVLIVVTLTLLLGLPADLFAQGDSANAEKEVKDALEKYRKALVDHDVAALKQIWADDYTFINGAGEILTKDQRLANQNSGATSLEKITMG